MLPFADKTDMQIMKLIFQGTRPPRREEPPLDDKAWELIQRCWAEALERPGMKDAAEWMMAILSMSRVPFSGGIETLTFVDSAPTPPPHHVHIPIVCPMTPSGPTSPSLLPMISHRPSQTGIEGSSAWISNKSPLVLPQPFTRAGQSDAFSVSPNALL